MRPLHLTTCLAFLLAPPAFAQSQSSILATYDSNGDGLLSFAEFQLIQQDMFARADGNGDGLLTREELASYTPNPARVMARDANKDGALNVNEFLSQATGFRRADRNNDGVLGPKELARAEKFLLRAKG